MTADLNKLSPSALAAAMRGGTGEWGQWGSAERHILYVEPIERRRGRPMCRCGCRKRVTHGVFANGVILADGCEMDARRWAKKMSKKP